MRVEHKVDAKVYLAKTFGVHWKTLQFFVQQRDHVSFLTLVKVTRQNLLATCAKVKHGDRFNWCEKEIVWESKFRKPPKSFKLSFFTRKPLGELAYFPACLFRFIFIWKFLQFSKCCIWDANSNFSCSPCWWQGRDQWSWTFWNQKKTCQQVEVDQCGKNATTSISCWNNFYAVRLGELRSEGCLKEKNHIDIWYLMYTCILSL